MLVSTRVLSLYLNRPCTYTPLKGEAYDTHIAYEQFFDQNYAGARITPHLRKFDSITEEEALILYGMEHPGVEFTADFVHGTAVDWALMPFGGTSYVTPEQLLFLTSKGFDLFNLIEQGLAKEVEK